MAISIIEHLDCTPERPANPRAPRHHPPETSGRAIGVGGFSFSRLRAQQRRRWAPFPSPPSGRRWLSEAKSD